ncbi:Phospholipase [Rhodovastum atsumiense]|uniref:Phospholipase n=1 Tax=Rhodovastum atsumiense TaxID=504468 RepID=A0A5M6IWF5_9PROT|nr:alkaline phosphatase family protein [Rhodovastum atsumiense]KAA5612622.1 phospholipase [Rhodovastum atsumiense]CAH2601277.1 Phospholipase [Rhodovastum atsumiense]
MGGTLPDIRHVVVLMLENRSFDSMLGRLYPAGDGFDGVTGAERNVWHQPDGSQQEVPVWTDPELTAEALCIPNPDPGELFDDIQVQIHGLAEPGGAVASGPSMGGFVDNYMRQPPTTPVADPKAVMHCFAPEQVPVTSALARAFGVSDRWHASAPCQTWPNRFFAHAGTANGYVNNAPVHFPYLMETVFNRLDDVGQGWRIYFHDIPQAATLARLWPSAGNFRRFEAEFARDAAAGTLPAYSFIEPRYFADVLGNRLPNDAHPPHNVAHAEALVAVVYNAVRAGPGWKHTLLVITYDEHGGCYDHVVPPPATPPDDKAPEEFHFDYFGVRVPAVIVSPYVRAGSVIRPPGLTPFDHTSLIATLRRLFGFAPLTARDAAAPDLLPALQAAPENDGPAAVTAPVLSPDPALVARAAERPANDLQASLGAAATGLPAHGTDIPAHVRQLAAAPPVVPVRHSVADAAATSAAHMQAFLD